MRITLEGKVALITGGGAGIGLAIAESFAELGAKVVIAEIDSLKVPGLRANPKLGDDVTVIEADVRKAADVSGVISEIDRRHGRLDILVNNVGHHLSCTKPLVRMEEQEWDALYDINLRHMFVVTKAAIPLMRKGGGGGSIINLSSIEGFRGYPGNVAYTAFKHAVTGFTKGLAIELADDRIRVNVIGPESTDSEQVPAARIPPENIKILERSQPLGRFGQPQDIAGAAIYLALDELSSWVTGTTMIVDGGALAAAGFQRIPDGRWTNTPDVVGEAYRR